MPQATGIKIEEPVSVSLQHEATPIYREPVILALLGFFVGLVGAVLAEWLKRFFLRPKLAVAGKPSVEIARVPGSGPEKTDAAYLRVAVENTAITIAGFAGIRRCAGITGILPESDNE